MGRLGSGEGGGKGEREAGRGTGREGKAGNDSSERQIKLSARHQATCLEVVSVRNV